MRFPRLRLSAVVLAVIAASAGGSDLAQNPQTKAVLEHISAQSLRGHVSFLASDLLEGRALPSPGLDIAAEYVAAQFRRAGLQPIGDQGYFQTAKFLQFEPVLQDARIELESEGKTIAGDPAKAILQTSGAVALNGVPVLKFGTGDLKQVEKLNHAEVQNQAIALYVPGRMNGEAYQTLSAIRKLRPAILIVAGPGGPRQRRAQLIAADQRDREVALIGVREGPLASEIEHAPTGPTNLKLTAKIPAPKEKTVMLRNVAGLQRGSDPALKDTYILVTAHYDHMGVKPDGDGDRIFNGANDDASGTASVVEIASALAAMDPKPKRSILFIALSGEELGLLGSQYYGRHPLFPLMETVADINLEHMGRTDATDGTHVGSASFTGYDYSDLPALFEKAGEETGVKVYKDDKRSDPFFARSDNQALADLGIPAHTLCVAFEFPDYHGVGDEWQKIDYENMAKVDRMVALGLLRLASTETTPRWNESEPKAKRYLEAWRALHPSSSN